MTADKTYLLINTIPNLENMEAFQLYLSKIVLIFKEYGGQSLGRYKTVEQVMGDGGIKAAAVFEFPDAKTIKDMLAGEAFNALNDLRKLAYKKVDLMICQGL